MQIYCEESSASSDLISPRTSFSRFRQLSVKDVCAVSCQTDDKSINASLPGLPKPLSSVSLSACLAAGETKIREQLFIRVFHRFNAVRDSSDTKHLNGYRLMAVDGSEIPVSQDGSGMSAYSRTRNGGKRQLYYANPLCNVLNHVCLDAALHPCSEKDQSARLL